jgi:serine O-acetyltransferase
MNPMDAWINEGLPRVINRLEGAIIADPDESSLDGLDFTGRNDIYELLDKVLAVLFPASFSKDAVARADLGFFLSDTVRHIVFRLGRHIKDVFQYRCKKDKCASCNCEERAQRALIHLIEALPGIREVLLQDIDAAFDGDPAAKYTDEIILSYPCVEAIATHRIAHTLYDLDVPIIPRIMAERAHSRTGIDIHPGAKIGPRFFIDHGTGVVIGETTRIGTNVKIYQGVTLGAVSPFDSNGKPLRGEKRHPDIEDDVIIYANATILGGETVIGKGAVIGGNTWITRSVSPGAHIYNKPRT